ncbi:MAG: cation diffusion facilitator family transporter [Nitrospira sp.]
MYEAYQRVWSPPDVVAGPMLVIAVVGLGVNLVSMWILHTGAGESLNLRGAYLEVLGDAVASLGVILAALIIQITGWLLADPITSAAIGLFILPRTWSLMRQAVQILMEGVPSHLDVQEIETAMRNSHGVREVHDLHVWTLTSGKDALSAHVLVDDLADGQHIGKDLQETLRERFDIQHTTVQLESDRSPLITITPTSERAS